MDESRTRVHSHYMRELTLGKFIVKISEITLLETIGEGIACLKSVVNKSFSHLGEFGIVYKARLGRVGRNAREVAVKTLKGQFCHEIAFYYEGFSYVLHNPSQCCINELIVAKCHACLHQ